MPYKSVKRRDHFGRHFVTYEGRTIEIPHNKHAARLIYVQCGCGKIVQRQNWTISHIKTQDCMIWHYMNKKAVSYTVREDITKEYEKEKEDELAYIIQNK